VQKLQKEDVKSFLGLCRVHKVLFQDITNLAPEASQEQQEELQGKRELKATATMATTKATSEGRSFPGPFYAHTEEHTLNLEYPERNTGGMLVLQANNIEVDSELINSIRIHV